MSQLALADEQLVQPQAAGSAPGDVLKTQS